MEKVSLKSVSVESFAKFGFWSGVTLGIIGVIVKLLFPMSKISAGIPFFSYNASRGVISLIVFFVIAVLFTAIDFIIIALFINLFLKLSNGVDFYVEKGE
ncbi:MAG: hypothetical protein GWP10_11215 [Nitrospiraceae bacterium]|nr:hypothetical protein [Nitrospiraceae bacterium]